MYFSTNSISEFFFCFRTPCFMLSSFFVENMIFPKLPRSFLNTVIMLRGFTRISCSNDDSILSSSVIVWWLKKNFVSDGEGTKSWLCSKLHDIMCHFPSTVLTVTFIPHPVRSIVLLLLFLILVTLLKVFLALLQFRLIFLCL